MSATGGRIDGVTRRGFLVAGASFAAGAMGLGKASREPARGLPATDPIGETIDWLRRELPRRMSDRDIPGLSIALLSGGQVVWTEGFGHTDRLRGTRVTPDTPFLVGSISKSVTAFGVLAAERAGSLSLDAPVTRYLPWFRPRRAPHAEDGGPITLRHLLSHHAGLETWPPLGGAYDPDYHARTFDEVARSIGNAWLKHPAGARFEYSNQGIVLAGAALQEATGVPFARYMHDTVLGPLGMRASTFDRAETARGGFAVPYSGASAVPMHDGVVHPLLPAGGLVTTARDLGAFVAHQLRTVRGVASVAAPILPGAAELRTMYAPQFTAREQATGYGLGIYRALQHGTVRLSHGGVGYGISSHARWLPDHDLGIVVLTNQDSAHNAPAIADDAIARLLRSRLGVLPEDAPSRTPAEARVENAALARLAGSYLLYDGIVFTFEARRGALHQRAGRESVRLRALGPSEFAHGSRRFHFTVDADGIASAVRVVDPGYDPSTAENSVLHLVRNDRPPSATAPGDAWWRAHLGAYEGRFIGRPATARLTERDGVAYLDDRLGLRPIERNRFVLADGEAVSCDGERLLVGNRPYVRRR